jgi:hypothetical protein
LSAEVGTIEAEHPRLLARLDALVLRTQSCNESPACRIDLLLAFDDLLHDLRAHEAAENKVLRRGFGSSVAEYETPDHSAVNDL